MRSPLELRNDAWECLRQADQAQAQRDKAMLLIIAQGWASLAEQMEQMRGAGDGEAEDDAGEDNEVAELAAALAEDENAQSAGAN